MIKTLDCVLREGRVFFLCARCGHEQAIHHDRPLVPQLSVLSDSHHCLISLPDARAPLRLVEPETTSNN